MAKVKIATTGSKRAKKAELELDPVVFEAPVKPHLWHAEVNRQLATRRRGTHATKNRSAVSGGGAKPWRQKGTGRSRQGSTRAPQWEGGGAVFGPVPRDHATRLPRKARQAALRGALTQRMREDRLTVVEALELEAMKTRALVEALGTLSLGPSEPVLIVISQPDAKVERAARNLPWVTVLRAEGLNVYDVLRHPRLLLTREAVDAVQSRLGAPPRAEEASA